MAPVELDAAIAALDRGKAIVIPTDTVYGLAARPENAAAVRSVFEIKRRADDQPLPVLGADSNDLARVVVMDERAVALGRDFWPGSLTLVLARAEGFPYDLGDDGIGTVAVRVPDHPIALELLARTGPLAVTSANRSGAPPAITIEEARAALGDEVGVFLDGGRVGGAPSTVLDLSGEPRILREGAVPESELLTRFA